MRRSVYLGITAGIAAIVAIIVSLCAHDDVAAWYYARQMRKPGAIHFTG